jgi:hypothetical protein
MKTTEYDLLRSIAKAGLYGLDHFLMTPEERRTAKGLVRKGLVVGGTADTRQRQRIYSLTPEGEEMLDEALAGS